MKSNSRATASDVYPVTDRRSYIRRLFIMLGLDGPARINARFRERIKEVQKRGGRPSDGIVDYPTYRLILSEYRTGIPTEVHLFDKGDAVLKLNTDIAKLITVYGLPLRRPRGRIMGVDGMRAAGKLRNIYRLPEADCVDAPLLRAIERDIKSINAINESV